jgi:RNA polymerase sigma factor (sigma-70 family)
MVNSCHSSAARGPESRQAVNAISDTFYDKSIDAIKRRRTLSKSRQAASDRKALDSLLVIVFAALKRSSRDKSKELEVALAKLTPILRRYVARILVRWQVSNPWLMAEDVVQDLFLRFMEKELAKSYRRKRAARGKFLFGVLRRVLSEAYRKLKPGMTSPLLEDIVDPTPQPDETLTLSEVREQIIEAIDGLGSGVALALRTQYGFELPSAAILNLSDSARHSRTSRARKTLRPVLEHLMVH